MSLRSLLIFSLATLLPAFARAEPTTAPATTQAAMIPADQSTPRGTLKMLTLAMFKGDGEGIKSAFGATTPLEASIVEAVVVQKQAEAAFRNAAMNTFGPEDARMLVGDTDPTALLVGVESADEKITGDDAVVTVTGQALKLKKQKDKWTFPTENIAPPAPNAEVEQRLASINQHSQFIKEIATEITNGKYKSATDAGRALQKKVVQQMMGKDAENAATKPTTLPVPAGAMRWTSV